jgi:site-specific recombinase XerD
MATIAPVFNYRNRLNKRGKGAIHIYMYAGGKRKYFDTGIRVLPNEWDDRRGQVNVKNHNHILLNQNITRIVRQLEDYQMRVIEANGAFTKKDLEEISLGGLKASFIDFLKNEVNSDMSVVASTIRFRSYFIQKLQDAVGDISFSRVNYEMVDAFNKHLAGQGLKPATIRKYHNQLKKYCSIAKNKRKIKENPYGNYKIVRPVQGIKKCLWYDDLDKLWELEYPQDSMYELVRLKFLFSCYTGLRISDTSALTWDDIINNKVVLKMQKTARPVVVPVDVLGDRGPAILQRAKEYDLKTVFKPISDQVANRHLKRIGVDAGISTPLNYHVSRHTFCTLIADKTGSVFKVMEYAGIYRIDTAMVYVSLSRLYG